MDSRSHRSSRAVSKRLGALTRQIVTLRGQVGRDIYEIGRRLEEIRAERMWEAAGLGSFEQYLAEQVGFSRTTAYRMIRVAKHFNREIAARYGVAKLEAALRYLDATPVEERPGDLLAAHIRVRGRSGRYRSLPLHRATAPQIREATVLLLATARGRRIPKRLAQRLDSLASALPEAPPGTQHGARVRSLRGRDGKVALTFQAIPYDELEAFAEAILRHLGS